MKILKIIVGIFCFAITINTFRNGVPTYENLAHYAEFIPVLILFIIGILLFKSASKPEIKKNVVIISGNNNGYSNIEKIEEKLKILKEAYDDGINCISV